MFSKSISNSFLTNRKVNKFQNQNKKYTSKVDPKKNVKLKYFIKVGPTYFNQKYIKRIEIFHDNAYIIVANTVTGSGDWNEKTYTDELWKWKSCSGEYNEVKSYCEEFDNKNKMDK